MTRSKRYKNKQLISSINGILSFVKDVFIITGLVLITKFFILDFVFVSGHSMEPNIKDGEMVFIQKFDLENIEFYDIVAVRNVIISEDSEPVNIIKRVIGLPGDTISIYEGEIYRNNEKIEEPLIPEKSLQVNQSFEIKEGEVFLLGDNRNHSTDSRHFGTVPVEKVFGIVVASYKSEWFLNANEKLIEFFESIGLRKETSI